MSWVTKYPKVFIGLILFLVAAFFAMRFTHSFYQLRSFVLGVAIGLAIGIIPYLRYRFFNKKNDAA